MLLSLLKLIIGVCLIILPLIFNIHFIVKLLETYFPNLFFYKIFKILPIICYWIILEIIGLHLILDAIIPGKTNINVYAVGIDNKQNIKIEIAPVTFQGSTDFHRNHFGSFDRTGTYTEIITLNWGESQIFIKCYEQNQVNDPLVKRHIKISPYIRVGFWDKHICLEKKIILKDGKK